MNMFIIPAWTFDNISNTIKLQIRMCIKYAMFKIRLENVHEVYNKNKTEHETKHIFTTNVDCFVQMKRPSTENSIGHHGF